MASSKLHLTILKAISYNPYGLVNKEQSLINFKEVYKLKHQNVHNNQASLLIAADTLETKVDSEINNDTYESYQTGNLPLLIVTIFIAIVLVWIIVYSILFFTGLVR